MSFWEISEMCPQRYASVQDAPFLSVLQHSKCRIVPFNLAVHLQKNHLSGLQRKLLKITFWNVQALMEVRKELFPIISRNKGRSAVNDALTALQQQQQMQQQMVAGGGTSARGLHNASRVGFHLLLCK
jgi:hypothetical protein